MSETDTCKTITEGLARIRTNGNVFYNPVQEFNRDLSIAVLRAFVKLQNEEKIKLAASKQNTNSNLFNEICILEALSATGLRSIRYAKEVPNVRQIVANDLSAKAVDDIRANIADNDVANIVSANHEDATMLMYRHRKGEALSRFDAIDLDPYGCPAPFLDSAVQAIADDGGLLLVTATDMAVLAGNAAETCYSKYGAISLRLKACHEMALRILLQCIQTHAARYGRYIVPLLSISADFYIRVFVRVFSGPKVCKEGLSKLSTVYHCNGCGSYELRPLGVIKTTTANQKKYTLPPLKLHENCQHCHSNFHVGGPIWNAPIHSVDFLDRLQSETVCLQNLGTIKRIEGILGVIKEELHDTPLYYTLEQLSGTLHCETPPMVSVRSALLNAGHRVSYTHMHRTSIKTDAPSTVLWDIMREWVKTHPVNEKRLNNSGTNQTAALILNTPSASAVQYSFVFHPDANPASKKNGLLRFQQNPQRFWGPGTRATAMVVAESDGGDSSMAKSRRNQGRKKRRLSST